MNQKRVKTIRKNRIEWILQNYHNFITYRLNKKIKNDKKK